MTGIAAKRHKRRKKKTKKKLTQSRKDAKVTANGHELTRNKDQPQMDADLRRWIQFLRSAQGVFSHF
jgi:hypothetical protein